MRRFFASTCLASVLGLASVGGAANACDGYVVTRPVQTSHVVYRSAPVAVYSPVVYEVRKPVVAVEQAVVAVAKPVAEHVAVVAVARRTRVEAGSTLNVRTLFLGQEAGVVFLKHGGVTHRCVVHSWGAETATFTLPSLDVTNEIDASIEVVRSNGDVAKQIAIRLAAPASLVQVVAPRSSRGDAEIFDEAPAAPASVSFSSAPVN